LQTRAELTPDGKHFIVNGQKIWTSGAQHADWIFCLVRTDATVQKQKGISFLLIDMKTPGISIKPIRQIDDQSGFNETFFDNVKVPAENLVGEINQGWTVAKALLENERSGSGTVNLEGLLRRARTLATEYQYGGEPLLADADYRERLVQAEMDWDCYCYTRYRIDSKLMRGESLGPEASLMKLYVSELSQRVHDLGLEAMASDAAQWYGLETMPEAGFDLPMAMSIDRAFTIYSGSSEVQRNIIAKRVLGLPD
jgi:alkylation response protein AidB-like acyl-CoA dehydrogenase